MVSDKLILQQFLYRIRTSVNAVLQYDHTKRDLVVWYWPTGRNGERITPSDFDAHRLSHSVLGPCCLCPFQSAAETGDFKESAMYMIERGRYAGEYVAGCATGDCEYFVFMERIHSKPGVPIRRYRLRNVNDLAPPRVRSLLDDQAEMHMAPRGRPRDDAIDLRMIRICPAPNMGPMAVFDLLLRLDSIITPGLTEAEFYNLFAKCDACGLVMTRRVFQSHECSIIVVDSEDEGEPMLIVDSEDEVVDLTMIDD